MKWMALALAGAVLTAPALAADPDACEVPGHLAHTAGELKRVADAVKNTQRLDILVVGTGSSTLAGPEGAQNAYPARLQAALAARLAGGVTVTVQTDVKNRRTTAEMDTLLEAAVKEAKPSLVIWQTGTFDAMRGIDPEDFRAALEHGVRTVQAAGADLVLMNMQYSPRTESMIAAGPYAENMRWVAQHQGFPLFDRLAIMRHWNETGAFDLAGAPGKTRMAERVHDCLGKRLADLIMDAAHLNRDGSKDTQ